MTASPSCPYCYGTGMRYWHSDDCSDDLCALNGDIHSCRGQMEECPCTYVQIVIEPSGEMATKLKRYLRQQARRG